jgi:hypothetical protein
VISLSRLSYASRSIADHQTLRVHLSDIVVEAQRNNAKQQIGGVLCYSNHFFFQCIEGPTTAVDALYQKLLTDDRHHDLRLLERIEIDQPYFRHWSMRYITLDTQTQQFLKQHRLFPFQPYQLIDHRLQLFLLHLAQSNCYSTLMAQLPHHYYEPTRPAMTPLARPSRTGTSAWIKAVWLLALLSGSVVLLSLCLKN